MMSIYLIFSEVLYELFIYEVCKLSRQEQTEN